MSFRELTVNFTGNIKASLHITDMTVLTKHIYSLLKKVLSQESAMAMKDKSVKLNGVKVMLDDKEEINTSFGNFTVWNY